MYQYDVETFMCACDRKGLAAKTMKSYEQTLRLFGLFLKERGITQTEEIRHRKYDRCADARHQAGDRLHRHRVLRLFFHRFLLKNTKK